ncbi:MAG: phosphatase PAP2 family protein [Paludibacteraceae bacterium]|nr:phosphatase PAP2 family protein [Paludibacteraceae bacterium]
MFFGEIALLQRLEQMRTPFLDTLMEMVTLLGEETILIVMIAVLCFMFHKENAYRLCFLTVFSLGLNGFLKNLLKIPRPFSTGAVTCVRPETATGYSFPSGHTQNFATWSTAVAKILRKKRFLITALVLSVLMGFSRMYLGAHYPSDVMVGLMLGILVGFFGNDLYDKLKNPKKMYLPTFLGMILFAIFFLISPDPHFADYFKCVGLMGGLTVSVHLDTRYGNLSYGVPFYKKLLRVILAVVLALVFKKGMEALPVPQNLSLSLCWDFLRYLVLVTLVFGIYPLLLPKLKL